MTGSRRSSNAGFTLVEMLVACTITITIAASIFTVVNPAERIFKAQPEVSDMQQRIRVGVDTLARELIMAGAGIYTGSSAGPLSSYVAPIMPYRLGDANDDPSRGIYFRTDAISLLYVPSTPSQTTLSGPMSKQSQDFEVNAQPNCPRNRLPVCGFEDGVRALLIASDGGWDPITITDVQDPVLHHDARLSQDYPAGSWIAELREHTYYLKTDVATDTFQLMHSDGHKTEFPVVDNVVKLEFQYFGESLPPMLLPDKPLADRVGPYTTYGPKPPVLAADNENDSWPAGENCAFMVQNGVQVPRLPVLAAASQVALPSNILTDGPWCPDDKHARRFDADLLRIRRVRVTLRVQVAPIAMRGPAGVLFLHGGTANSAERLVPDQEVRFDVTPRNLNLGR